MVKCSFNYAICYIGLKGNCYKRIVSHFHEHRESLPAATTYKRYKSNSIQRYKWVMMHEYT